MGRLAGVTGNGELCHFPEARDKEHAHASLLHLHLVGAASTFEIGVGFGEDGGGEAAGVVHGSRLLLGGNVHHLPGARLAVKLEDAVAEVDGRLAVDYGNHLVVALVHSTASWPPELRRGRRVTRP